MTRIGAELLERAFVRTLRARGLSQDHADWVAQALVQTSLPARGRRWRGAGPR
jgi:LDH2 family malate/lactate/ureidoglycolate dehydrogenase